ncbi:MAG TPA: pyridoxamine 5'-phosphate oxidase [Actinomycetes bacterium]|nr:pyridoxamine 5'-phosphate oxidase [Actinomycetes bacterium]
MEPTDSAAARREYRRGGLTEAAADPDPIRQFAAWFAEADGAGMIEPNAMALATATPDGRPSARMVLLKQFDERGFVFYSNYRSRKGAELAANPRAALCLWWPPLERQVRVEGTVERLGAAESRAYFDSRPRGSRLGALASPQSEVIASRELLERRFAELDAAHPGDVPPPEEWGGLRVVPDTIEFWQGRPDRLHDRLRYRLEQGAWTRERLAP